MPRFALLALALLAVPLIAAAPSSPFATKPRVVVYPFTPTGSSVDREAGSRLATIVATEMANTGRATVVPPPPGTERKDFLSVAKAHDCDYYVTGFLSPLGDGVSVVEQVVSTSTGIVVYSSSIQLRTYGDAAGLGDDLAAFVSLHANRGLASFGTPPPAPSASPTAAPSGADVNVGKLFGRIKRATAAPKAAATAKPTTAAAPKPSTAPAAVARSAATATPAPQRTPNAAPATAVPRTVAAAAAPAPAGTYAVVPVTGSASAALRMHAAELLAERTHGERVVSASDACALHADAAILDGTLAIAVDPLGGGSNATFELTATDCAGKTRFHRSFLGAGQKDDGAIAAAVDAAVAAYLAPPPVRRSR